MVAKEKNPLLAKFVFIGFMGSGKSSVAKSLSLTLRIPCIEMDEQIAAQFNYPSVARLIDEKGLVIFRKAEESLAQSLRESRGVVISTGGGVVQSDIAMDALAHSATEVVYLRAPFETLEKRIISQKEDAAERPLFRDREKALSLYQSRVSLYEKWATRIVDTEALTIDQVVSEILS